MDRMDVLRQLKDMFENDSKKAKENDFKEPDYIIEQKLIDKNSYLSLVAKENEGYIQTHPDFDIFLNILKYYNTKSLNYAYTKLVDNKKKFFVDYTSAEREKFLNEVRDLYSRLINSNSMTIVLIEDMIVSWVDKITKN